MPRQLQPTGSYFECELPVTDFGKAATNLLDVVGYVLVGPGEEDDRFYFVSNVFGQKEKMSAMIRVRLTQARELPAPDWWKDWREIFRTLNLDSPLATRMVG
jgi:hypothetical protein